MENCKSIMSGNLGGNLDSSVLFFSIPLHYFFQSTIHGIRLRLSITRLSISKVPDTYCQTVFLWGHTKYVSLCGHQTCLSKLDSFMEGKWYITVLICRLFVILTFFLMAYTSTALLFLFSVVWLLRCHDKGLCIE